MGLDKYIEGLDILAHYGVYEMLRIEYQTYDDGTYYYLYVTNSIRIETDGVNGFTLELRDGTVRKIADPEKYLTLEDDEYFNESLINEHLDTVIEAVKVLFSIKGF
ncbi:hypothetical protein [Rahnella sp. EDr1-12]|uniref:hypothetical protein n=1 Tax=unclassified Rahnella TaxID=2635087 RepID=UPI003BA8D836